MVSRWVWLMPIIVGVFLTFGVPPSQSSLCVQSVVSLTPQATICAPSSSYVDSALYASSASSNSGVWGSSSFFNPGQVTTASGVLKVYYVLAQGATLTKYSLKSNYGVGAYSPVASLQTGTDSYSTWFGTGSLGNVLTSVGQTAQFQASILDSLGTNSTFVFSFQLVAAATSGKLSVTAYDATNPGNGNGAPLSGLVVKVSQSNNIVQTMTTDSTGTAVAILPPGNYVATAYAPSGYVTSASSPLCPNQWVTASAVSFTMTGATVPLSYTFAKGSQSQCNTTLTITNTASTTIITPTITTQSVSCNNGCTVTASLSCPTTGLGACSTVSGSTGSGGGGGPGLGPQQIIGAALIGVGLIGFVAQSKKRS